MATPTLRSLSRLQKGVSPCDLDWAFSLAPEQLLRLIGCPLSGLVSKVSKTKSLSVVESRGQNYVTTTHKVSFDAVLHEA